MPRRGGRAGSGSKPRSPGCSPGARAGTGHRRSPRRSTGGLAGQQEHRRGADARDGPGRAAKEGAQGHTRPGKGRWRAPDLVRHELGEEKINQKWYGDGTEIATGEGKLQLDSVLDMGSRRIVGFALGEHHDAELAYGALAMAVAVRGGQVPGVILHTDQGSEYTRAGSGRPASGFPSPSPWAGPGRRWITRSSSPGTPPWSSSSGHGRGSPRRRRRGQRSPPGSRNTTTTAGTRRWAWSARWITSGP